MQEKVRRIARRCFVFCAVVGLVAAVYETIKHHDAMAGIGTFLGYLTPVSVAYVAQWAFFKFRAPRGN